MLWNIGRANAPLVCSSPSGHIIQLPCLWVAHLKLVFGFDDLPGTVIWSTWMEGSDCLSSVREKGR
jgi:hypothetical protein